MNTKLLIYIFLLVCYAIPQVHSNPPTNPTSISAPFLALIETELKTYTEYDNGAFLSMLWVMTVSETLAKVPTASGKPRTPTTVYGGIVSLNEISKDSANHRSVINIVTDVKEAKNNKIFPQLVLLQVESEFERSDRLQPAIINVGDLSNLGMMVGFPQGTSKELMEWSVRTWSNKVCKSLTPVKYKEQFCSMPEQRLIGSHEANFQYGALLVDQNLYVTGMLQFAVIEAGSEASKKNLLTLILVRLSAFQSFWRSYENQTKEEHLKTNFKDEWKKFPWNNAVGLFSPWVLVLDTSLLFFLFLFYRQNGTFVY